MWRLVYSLKYLEHHEGRTELMKLTQCRRVSHSFDSSVGIILDFVATSKKVILTRRHINKGRDSLDASF